MARTPTPDATPHAAESEEARSGLPGLESEQEAVDSSVRSGSAEFEPEELRAISQDLAERFPIPIETTELVLMDVDPHHVHAYWNITPADLAAARTNANHEADETTLVLRLNDVSPGPPAGGSPHVPIDIPVHGLENHWHVELGQDAKSYRAELGLRMPDGHLALLARSNAIEMPQAGQSKAPAEPRTDDSPHAPQIEPIESADAAASGTVPDLTLAEKSASPLAPAFPNVDGSGVSATGIGAGVDEIPTLPASPADAATPWPPVRTHGPVFTGSPSPLETGAGTSPGMGVETYSSSTLATDTDFEIQAELHIYGRGTPGGHMRLFGQQVALGPDGRFSVRKPLSDPWTAVSLLATEPADRGPQGGDA